jgi:hypothetical protein
MHGGRVGTVVVAALAWTAASRRDAAAESPPANKGKPTQAGQADFWLWPRTDGSVRVIGAAFEIAFPGTPTITRPAPEADVVKAYQLQLDEPGCNLLLSVTGFGENEPEQKDRIAQLRKKLGKLGKLDERDFKAGRLTGKSFHITQSDGLLIHRVSVFDAALGISYELAAQYWRKRPDCGRFAESFLPRADTPITYDEKLVIEKKGKAFKVRDAGSTFSLVVPIKPTYVDSKRFDNQAGFDRVFRVEEKGKPYVAFTAMDFGVGEGLRLDAEQQFEYERAGVEKDYGRTTRASKTIGKNQFVRLSWPKRPVVQWMLWDRYRSRELILICRPDCPEIVRSIEIAAPKPPTE